MELLTIAQAAERVGVTRKAMARRVERGTVPSKLDPATGLRVIPAQALPGNPEEGASAPESGARGAGEPHAVPADLTAVLGRLEQLAAENGRLRALTEVAESTEQALRDELHRTRAELQTAAARVAALEAIEHTSHTPRRRWWRRSSS